MNFIKKQWNEKLFQEAITEWVWKYYVIPIHKDNQTAFGRALGFKDGREIRAILKKERRWHIEELGKFSILMDTKLATIVSQIEFYYDTVKNKR